MNKQQFIKTLLTWLDEYNIESHKVHVSHGGSMLMMGLKDSTNDVDLTVSYDVFERFTKESYPTKNLGNGRYLIQVTDNIDIHCMERDISPEHIIKDESGVYYRDAQTTLDDYVKLNRPKDKEKFGILERYIYSKSLPKYSKWFQVSDTRVELFKSTLENKEIDLSSRTGLLEFFNIVENLIEVLNVDIKIQYKQSGDIFIIGHDMLNPRTVVIHGNEIYETDYRIDEPPKFSHVPLTNWSLRRKIETFFRYAPL